eukprot:359116-Chlamydomonas_euryale.AAC.15
MRGSNAGAHLGRLIYFTSAWIREASTQCLQQKWICPQVPGAAPGLSQPPRFPAPSADKVWTQQLAMLTGSCHMARWGG